MSSIPMDPERFSHLQQEFCNEFHIYGSREILSFGNKSFAMSFIPMDLETFSHLQRVPYIWIMRGSLVYNKRWLATTSFILFSWKARVNQQPPEHHHPLEGWIDSVSRWMNPNWVDVRFHHGNLSSMLEWMLWLSFGWSLIWVEAGDFTLVTPTLLEMGKRVNPNSCQNIIQLEACSDSVVDEQWFIANHNG